MRLSGYGVLRERGVVPLLVLGFFARLPHSMCGLVLTLHTVRALGRSYAEAGLVTAALAVGQGLGAPWRGRAVDTQGLRRAMVLSLVGAGAWLVAPFLEFTGLVVAAFVGGVLLVPAYSVTRQSLAVLVRDSQRETAFTLDAVGNEVTWMVGPLLAVVLATGLSSAVALVVLAVVSVGSAVALMVVNPPTRSTQGTATPAAAGSSSAVGVAGMLGLFAAMAVIFVGVDVSILAALNEAGRPGDIGWVVACWSAGSLVGGLAYAGMRRRWSPVVLMTAFVLLITPAALAPVPVWLAVVLFVSGVPCAPTLAAVTTRMTELVPEHRRGEALGWMGTALTVGSTMGAPSVGWVIDHNGASWGFVTSTGIGVTVVGLVVVGTWAANLVRARTSGRGAGLDAGHDTGPVSLSPGPSPGASG
ncbi:MAG: MFS transporter [Micrococcales bacterium]|nr:MFS transporter [Micrococcales bacterium]MCL2666701.1 MFS transporter [Micrococcales bacterium]